jgi:predicted nucleotidyltransferase
MTFGLSEKDIASIIAVLRRHSEVQQAYIFGSRAQGNYKPGSDVDIALDGLSITHDTVVAVSMELNEETLTPYRFDVLDIRAMENPDLVESIKQTGVILYKAARPAA